MLAGASRPEGNLGPQNSSRWQGKFIKGVGEEYQVLRRGREYHGYGEEYNVEKRESNIIFPIILRLKGRSGEDGKSTEIMGKKSRLNMGMGKNFNLWETLYIPAGLCGRSSFRFLCSLDLLLFESF